MSRVYLIRAAGSGFVKIGWTVNVRSRLELLQTGCPFELEIAGEREGGEPLERDIHRAAAAYRQRGEWFVDCPQVATAFHSTPAPVISEDGHRGVIHRVGGIHSLSLLTGVPYATVNAWMTRRRIPARHWSTIARTGKVTLPEIAATLPPRKGISVPATFDKPQDAAA